MPRKGEVNYDDKANYKVPSHRVCKPAYLMPVPSQDKLGGCARKGIRHKNGGDDRDGGTN